MPNINEWNDMVNNAVKDLRARQSRYAKQQAQMREMESSINTGMYAADQAEDAIKGYTGSFNLTGAQRRGLVDVANARMALSSGANRQAIFDRAASDIKGLGAGGLTGSRKKQMGYLAETMGRGLGMGSALNIARAGSDYEPSADEDSFYQAGGIIPGSGSGDKVPIMAEPGEIVIPRDVVDFKGKEFFFNLIDKTKATLGKQSNPHGKPQGYSEGGVVNPFSKLQAAMEGGDNPSQQPKPKPEEAPHEHWWSRVVRGLRPEQAPPPQQPPPNGSKSIGITRILGYGQGGQVGQDEWEVIPDTKPAFYEQAAKGVSPNTAFGYNYSPSFEYKGQVDAPSSLVPQTKPNILGLPTRTKKAAPVAETAPAPKPAPAPSQRKSASVKTAKTASSPRVKGGSKQVAAPVLGITPDQQVEAGPPNYNIPGLINPEGIGAYMQDSNGLKAFRENTNRAMVPSEPLTPEQASALDKAWSIGKPQGWGGGIPVSHYSPSGGLAIDVAYPVNGKMPAFNTGDAYGLGIQAGLTPEEFRRNASELSTMTAIRNPTIRANAQLEYEKLPAYEKQQLAESTWRMAEAEKAQAEARTLIPAEAIYYRDVRGRSGLGTTKMNPVDTATMTQANKIIAELEKRGFRTPGQQKILDEAYGTRDGLIVKYGGMPIEHKISEGPDTVIVKNLLKKYGNDPAKARQAYLSGER